MFYSEFRYTKDLDLWIEPSDENAARVFRALAEFGAPLAGLTPKDLTQDGCFYQIGMPPARVDVLMSIDGVRFDEAWQNRTESTMGGEPVCLIGRADRVKNKRATGRPIDLHDLSLLE